MRKLFVTGLLGFALSGLVSAANAQSFLFGLGTGLMLGSSTNNQYGGDNANVLYLAPRAAERIRDPLSIHVVASAGGEGGCAGEGARQAFAKLSLADHFALAVPKSEKYEVLQVVRAMRPDSASCLVLWFAFVEKDKLVQLGMLPPLTQNK